MGGQGLCSVTADGNKNFNNHKSGRKTLTEGLCSVTADGNKNFNNHNSGHKTLADVNVLRPDL